jgi:hypothetical protein
VPARGDSINWQAALALLCALLQRGSPKKESVLFPVRFGVYGDHFFRFDIRYLKLMGNNPRARLELLKLRQEPLEQRRWQVNRDDVSTAQVNRENVLVLDADKRLKIFLLNVFSR